MEWKHPLAVQFWNISFEGPLIGYKNGFHGKIGIKISFSLMIFLWFSVKNDSKDAYHAHTPHMKEVAPNSNNILFILKAFIYLDKNKQQLGSF